MVGAYLRTRSRWCKSTLCLECLYFCNMRVCVVCVCVCLSVSVYAKSRRETLSVSMEPKVRIFRTCETQQLMLDPTLMDSKEVVDHRFKAHPYETFITPRKSLNPCKNV